MNITCINGDQTDHVNASDRALQYGDGLFETIVIREGEIQFWKQHIQRLKKGCQRLGINNVDYARLTAEAEQLCCNQSDAILKIIISRGITDRGYRFNTNENKSLATRILSLHKLPSYPQSHYDRGINLRLCQLEMGLNPTLAGIKHLNRLEQVMARNEWQDETIFEGLMRDHHQNIIEGTMSNFFIVKNDRLLTANLSYCGVAGIVRQLIIDDKIGHQLPIEITQICEQQLISADEVFICNSVIGIMPVKTFSQQTYGLGPVTKLIMRQYEDFVRQTNNCGF